VGPSEQDEAKSSVCDVTCKPNWWFNSEATSDLDDPHIRVVSRPPSNMVTWENYNKLESIMLAYWGNILKCEALNLFNENRSIISNRAVNV